MANGRAGRACPQIVGDESLRYRLQLIQRSRRLHAHLLQPVFADEEDLLILAGLGDPGEGQLAAIHLGKGPQLVIAPFERLFDPLRVQRSLRRHR